MPLPRSSSVLLVVLLFSVVAAGQPSSPRDSQAVAIVQQSIAAMGGVAPADSVAIGTIELVAGSKTGNGTIRILTRGLEQTVEEILTSEGRRAVIYSRHQASEAEGNSARTLQLELVVSSRSPCFPLVVVAAALNDPETAFRYLGEDSLDGFAVHRVRFWKTFASQPKLQHLAEFSVNEVWIDAASGVPRKLAFERRAAGGAEPSIPVEVFYSDYRKIGGVLFPFQVLKSLNGTPWATITLDSVALNTGLTDRDFPVR